MPIKKSLTRKNQYVPESLIKVIEKQMKELKLPTRVEAMEKIAEVMDKIIIKRKKII